MSFIIHRNWSYKINIFSGLDFDMGNDALVYKTVETQAVYPLTAQQNLCIILLWSKEVFLCQQLNQVMIYGIITMKFLHFVIIILNQSSTGIFPHLRNLFLCRFLLFMPYNPKGYMSYFSSFSFSKSFMLLTLIAKVDVLCKSADVAGCITPPIPHKINPVLKPTICR